MKDLFDFGEDDVTQESNGAAQIKKIGFRKKIRTDNRNNEFQEIMQGYGLPKQNEAILLKSNGLSDTGNIFRYILDNHQIKNLYLATWVISRENVDTLLKAIDEGKIETLYFVVSKRLKELKKSIYAHLVEEFQKRKGKIFFKVCNSHAKTFSAETLDGNYYTVTGSGNWTENPRIENYIILNDIDALEHNKEWMTDLIE